METLFGKVVSDLLTLAMDGWFKMAFVCGSIVLVWVALFGTPYDTALVCGIASTCVFFGIAETESRHKHETLHMVAGQIVTKHNRLWMPTAHAWVFAGLGVIALVSTIGRAVHLLLA